MPHLTLNRVQYGGLDFDTIEDDLRAQLQVRFAASFNDFSVSSLGIVLLDTVSFGLDTLAFYLDRRATDTYLATARTRRSVALLTRQLGYKMGGAVAASTDLQVGTAVLYGFPIPIPKGFKFLGPNDIIFETAQAVTIPANTLTPVSIPVYQGVTGTETFVSDGSANQQFDLTKVPDGSAVVQGTVVVSVNGSPFEESEFISFDATDQFEINYNGDPPTIRFGDGVAGNIPIKGGSISVTYVSSLGAGGQSLSHTITAAAGPLVVLLTDIDLVADNPENTVGGSDLEDLDHAKTYAPRVFKSRRVAVTRQDYEALAGSFADPLFGRVAVAQAISARSASDDLELQNLIIDTNTAISVAVAAVEAAINTPSTGALALTDGIATNNTALQSALNLLLTKLTSVNTNLGSLLSTSRTIKSNSSEQQVDYTDAATEVTVGKNYITSATTFINGFAVAGSTQITAGDKTTLLGHLSNATNSFNKVDSLLTLINALSASIGAGADSMTTVVQAIQSIVLNEIGISVLTPNSIVKDMQDRITSQLGQIGTSVAPYSALYLQLQTILAASGLAQDQVAENLDAIEVHVDKFLSADCKANLVVVPILARDAAGFYAGPSNGLIQSVQNYLDGIKEVTQTVEVTSGSLFLVPAVIRVRLAVRVGISEQVTQASAATVVDGILRDRAFGASLFLSDLVEPLRALAGVAFVNVTLEGYRPVGSLVVLNDKLDTDGNLVVRDSEVITLSQTTGDLAITTELFTTTNG